MVEQSATRLKARQETAVDTGCVDPLTQAAVDLADLEGGGDEPHVPEGDVGELAAPLGRDTDTTTRGQDLVAEALPTLVTLVGTRVYAVDAVRAVYLTDDVIEDQCL